MTTALFRTTLVAIQEILPKHRLILFVGGAVALARPVFYGGIRNAAVFR